MQLDAADTISQNSELRNITFVRIKFSITLEATIFIDNQWWDMLDKSVFVISKISCFWGIEFSINLLRISSLILFIFETSIKRKCGNTISSIEVTNSLTDFNEKSNLNITFSPVLILVFGEWLI